VADVSSVCCKLAMHAGAVGRHVRDGNVREVNVLRKPKLVSNLHR